MSLSLRLWCCLLPWLRGRPFDTRSLLGIVVGGICASSGNSSARTRGKSSKKGYVVPKKRPVKALVSVKEHWTKNMGLGGLFQAATPHTEETEFRIIPVSRYNISDDRFVEIEFYPRLLKDKWACVFIPKDEVVATYICAQQLVGRDISHCCQPIRMSELV
jgi:hypothetical protein